jgi:ankyrin repeat protein
MAVLCVAPIEAASEEAPLIQAVRARDLARVRTLLAQRADVNAPQGDGATALHWAVHLDDMPAVEALLGAGARAGVADDTGATPLFLACTNRSGAIVQRLLRAGADANAALLSGETALMTCARSGEAAGVKALLENGARPNTRESAHDQTALMWAAARGQAAAVQALLAGGADVRARSRAYQQTVTSEVTQRAGREELNYDVTRGGSTPILFAARSGDRESARLLLAAGADVNDTTPDGASALVIAAHSGHGALAALLLDNGANPDAAAIGYTALHAAVLRSDLALVRALIAHRANVNAVITRGTPMRRNSQDFDLPRTLLGATPYLLAAKFLEPDIMRALASAGANTRMPMADGATPLMAAAGMGIAPPATDERRGSDRRGLSILDGGTVEPDERVIETVKAAIDAGSELDAANPAGDTALHIAVGQGRDAVTQLLVESGARLDLRNRRGQTALGLLLARSAGTARLTPARTALLDLMRQRGAVE